MDFVEISEYNQIREPNQYGLVYPSRAKRMLNRITLDITYECDLKCPNCNRLCGILPRKNEISLSSIEEFINKSIELKKKWVHIYITGGEPSFHSRVKDIFKQVIRYVEFHKKEFDNNLTVKYCTNNHSKKSRQVLKSLPDFIVYNSYKKNSEQIFKPMCVAPVDLGFYDDNNLHPCIECCNYGMTLNYRGYYPCGESAAIDDVLIKKNLGIKKLEDVTLERMAEILHETCRYCGYYFDQFGTMRNSKLMVSSTWKQFLTNEKRKV